MSFASLRPDHTDPTDPTNPRASRRLSATRLLPVLALASAAGLFCGVEQRETSPTVAPTIEAAAVPASAGSLPVALRFALLQKAQKSAGPEYALAVDAAHRETTLSARSPQTEVAAQLDAQGVHVGSLKTSAAPGLSVALSAYGCQGALRKAEPSSPRAAADKNRAEYVRPDLVEWYVNSPVGLEHGFTVERDPHCAASAKLAFELALQTEATQSLAIVGSGALAHLEVRDSRGTSPLRYGDLFALDADGKELPARLVLAGSTLRIEVDAATARYPVTVDPTWTLKQTLRASDRLNADVFGSSVALSKDGGTALIGAPGKVNGALALPSSGAAYVFVRSGGTWMEEQKLLAMDFDASDNFGNSVALSADGNTALIGARRKSDVPASLFNMGAAYVFTRSAGTWAEKQKVSATTPATNDYFGTAVALSADGTLALISSAASTATPGSVYTFTRSVDVWTVQQKLNASDKANNDSFGSSVALSADASVALVGAQQNSESPTTRNGAAYVFTRSGASFTQQKKLTADDKANSDLFGFSVALSADGITALVGARDKRIDTTNVGAGYVFTYSGTSWTQQQKFVPPAPTGNDHFGFSVALSGSGNTALIGSDQYNDLPAVSSGAAYLFTRSGVTWTQQYQWKVSDPMNGDKFGTAVALSRDGGNAFIGTPGKMDGMMNSVGAVDVFISDGSPDGTACTMGSQCLSGNCTDGYCCDFACGGSDTSDCRSCLGAQTGLTNGSCGRILAATSYTCRDVNGARLCDAAEQCNGASDSCPQDKGTPDTSQVCRPIASGKVCDRAENCDGSSPDCPVNGYRPMGTLCRNAGGICDAAESCTGTSPDCPANKLAMAGTVCKAAGASAICDPADLCDGIRATCPAKYALSGVACGGAKTCNGIGICR